MISPGSYFPFGIYASGLVLKHYVPRPVVETNMMVSTFFRNVAGNAYGNRTRRE